MSFIEDINKLIEELNLPAGQAWVTLDELIKKAKEIDDDQIRLND